MSIKTARVNLWGDFIGALAIDERLHLATFEYDPEWIQKGIEIAPIRMPLSTRKYSFPGLNSETYKGLPAVFADSLPDDFGNAVINAWLTRQGRSSESFTSIERLLYTGNRGIGALEYAPALRRGKNPLGNLELESLIHIVQNILNQRAGLIAGQQPDNDKAMETIFQLGTSAGGARDKAIVAINKKRTSIRSGQLTVPKGFEHYILKFDGVSEQNSSSEIFGSPYKTMQVRKISYLQGIGTVMRYLQFSGEFVSPICNAGVLWLYFFINFSFSLLIRIRKLL